MDTGVLATSLIDIDSGAIGKFCKMFVEAYSTTLYTVSQATMGVKASKLLAIDMLKCLCGGVVDIPLTEDDCFDEHGEIDDEKFE